jgi:WD40 repeat protein
MRTLTIPRGRFFSLAYSPDGRTLASTDSRGSLRFWDLGTGAEGLSLRALGGGQFGSIAYSPDGRMLLACRVLWDLTATPPTPVALGVLLHREPVLSPDGRTLAVPTTRGLQLWDTAERRCLRTVPGFPAVNYSLAFSPDGRLLAASGFEPAIRVWDVMRGEEVTRLGRARWLFRTAFSPDGRLLAAAGHGLVQLWDVAERRCAFPPRTFRGHAHGLAFHPGGRLMAAGDATGRVRFWDVATGAELACFAWKAGAINAIAFSPDGMTAAAAAERGTIVVWDVDAV